MTRASSDAQQIYQYLLDEIDDAITAQDYAAYRGFFEIPHRLETFDATIIIKTEEQLRRIFDATCQGVLTSGVDGLSRTCTIADFSGADTIKGSHETRLIDAKNNILDGYTALSTLRRTDGLWRVAHSQYAEGKASLPSVIVQKHQRNWRPD